MESASLMLWAAPLLRDVLWKSLVVFAAAGLVSFWLRRRSAAARHALWLGVFVSLLCLPALCVWLPRRTLPILPAVPRSPYPAPPAQILMMAPRPLPPILPDRPAASMPTPASDTNGSAPTPMRLPLSLESRPAPVPLSPAARLVLLWLGGVTVTLARTFFGFASARRLIRGCVPISHGALTEAADEARQALGLARPVALRQDQSECPVAVPMTFGLIRPVILLPQGAAGWPAARLRVVLLHEMAHVGRGDWATLVLAQLACALYWFHPLVWLAARRLRAESEEACDDRVLTCGIPAPDYADHLLEIVRALPRQGRALPAVTMAQSREIAGRLQTILTPTKDRRGVTRRGLVLALLAGLASALPLAAMHPARRPDPATVKTAAVLTDAPWTAKLPDGTLVRLLAVVGKDRSGQVKGTWAPNGDPLRGSEAASGRADLTSLVNLFPDPGGVISLHMATTPPKPYEISAVSTSSNRRGHLDIELRFSDGPYTTLVSAPLGQGASHRLPSGEMVTLSKGITGWQNGPLTGGGRWYLTQFKLTLPLRFDTPDYESKLETVGADGKAVALTNYLGGSANGSGANRQILYNFRPSDLKSRHVTAIRFVTRPADHFTFRDVALQPNLPADAAHPAGLPPISQTFDPLDADPAVRERARRQRIATALRLRGALQGWAERNAGLLRQMRQAGPNDLAALLRVYAQVPPPEAYLNRTAPLSASAEFGALGAPPTLSHLRKSQEPLDVGLREDFARCRDFRLSTSVNTGRLGVTLWASGRVTETYETERVVGHRGIRVLTDTADIAPAYPFLK